MSSCTSPCAAVAFANAASATLARAGEPISVARLPPIAAAYCAACRLHGRSFAAAATPIMSSRQSCAFSTTPASSPAASTAWIQRATARASVGRAASGSFIALSGSSIRR